MQWTFLKSAYLFGFDYLIKYDYLDKTLGKHIISLSKLFRKWLMKKMLIVVVLFLLCLNVWAFDGNRKGFILGLGLGFSHVSYEQTIEYDEDEFKRDTESAEGIASDFKIGYGVSPNLSVYYSAKSTWSSMDSMNGDVTILDQVSVLGCSFYVTDNLYLSSGLGLWGALFRPVVYGDWTGSGIFIGGGYEFAKHYSLNIDLFISDPSHSENGYTATTDSVGFFLTFIALSY